MTHAAVWIDHKEARIFQVHSEAADEPESSRLRKSRRSDRSQRSRAMADGNSPRGWLGNVPITTEAADENDRMHFVAT